MLGADAMMRLSTDFGIRKVRVDDIHPEIQLVVVRCGCLGVWWEGWGGVGSRPQDRAPSAGLVGFAEMCAEHWGLKVLARVEQSRN